MLRVIAIGRARNSPEAALFARYAARMQPRMDLVEIAEAPGTPAEAKRREAALLLAALPARALAVALDLGGEAYDSAAFAARLTAWLDQGRPVCFLIGGPEGLDASVLGRADVVLSLGRPTWPHLLVRAMLAEQLYRARAIAQGHPYHRVSRPGPP